MTTADRAAVRTEPAPEAALVELLAEYLLAAEVGPPPVLAEWLARLPSGALRERFVDLLDEVAFAGRHLPLRLRPQLVLAGRYELVDPIGSGGMGQVWRARDQRLDADVAVKVLNVAAATAVDLDRLVAREGQLLARLSHPGIVRVLDVGADEEHRFVVMELVPGIALDEAIGRLRARRESLGRPLRGQDALALLGPAAPGRTPLLDGTETWSRTAVRVVVELLRTLEATHGVGVVHRDLKPGNVRWTGGGHPVLLDFGIGFRTDRPPGTRTSELFGTAPYAAPEQWADGSGVGPHTDVYQAGLVLYELLTLQRCFDGATPIETLRAIREARYRRPRELDPGIDEQLERCVLQAIEIDPARRYASARAFREDLERHLRGELPEAARPVARWSWHARAVARRHRSALALAAAVLVGAAGVWFASRGSPRVSIVWDGRSIRIEAPVAGRIAGFLIGVDAHGEERSRPLDFGRSVVRDVPAGVTTIDLGAGLESFRDVLVSVLFAAHGDDEVERRFAAAVAPLEQARREVEQREGQWLPATNLRAQFLAGRGAAASSLPVEALFAPGAWADAGLQGVVVGRPPS